MVSIGKRHASRTIEYRFHCIADIVHFVIDFLDLAIDLRYFVVDAVSDLQELRGCHPNFLLRQSVQSTERVFKICLSHKPFEKLF